MSWWGWGDSDSEDDAAVEQILASFRHRSSLRANLEDPQSTVLHDPDLLLSIMVQHAAVITEQGGVVTEAGLRSYNREMPEEINRVLTDHLSDMLFCSSEEGRTNLATEGVTERVHVVGDVMFDAFRHYAPQASDAALPAVALVECYSPLNGTLQ